MDDGRGCMEILLQNITKAYGEKPVLRGISLQVREHSLTTLLGPSGCGKTTLLRILAGLETPDRGDIFLGDRCICSCAKNLWVPPEKRGIGFVFQDFALWPHMTVFENVAFGLRAQGRTENLKQEVERALSLVQLKELSGRYPSELSGGQQQRCAIGRAIVKNPDILLCDEPTGALDYHTSKEILKLIETVNQKYGNTVIMVTHNDAIKNMADRVVKLRDGQIRKNYLNDEKMKAEALDW